MSGQRVRLSVLADELSVDFYGLFQHFCQVDPTQVDNNLTVPARWRGILQAFRDGKIVA